MIDKPELDALKQRAHAARISMPQLCRKADIFPSSWYRAFARGSADYTLVAPLEKVLTQIEKERAL